MKFMMCVLAVCLAAAMAAPQPDPSLIGVPAVWPVAHGPAVVVPAVHKVLVPGPVLVGPHGPLIAAGVPHAVIVG